ELDHLALPRLELFERPVHAPSDIRLLRLLLRPRLARYELGELGVCERPAAPKPVDDRVPGHGVQPAAGRTTLGTVRRGGAPDRGERLLHGVLRVPTDAGAPQSEAEHRPHVPLVEELEGSLVAFADTGEQLGVGAVVVDRLGGRSI